MHVTSESPRIYIYSKCVAQVCVCSSPPSLTCTQKKCPLIAAVSRHRADCREVRDQLGCCLLSYTCPPAQSETGTATPAHPPSQRQVQLATPAHPPSQRQVQHL